MLKKRLIAIFLPLVLLIGFQPLVASPVFASVPPVCPYGQSLWFYNNTGCTFNDSQVLNSANNHWSRSHYVVGILALGVYIDGSVASDVRLQAQSALNDWTNSAANVDLYQTSSISSANIVIYGLDPVNTYVKYFDARDQCLGTGGQTAIGIDGNGQVQIYLNYHYWDAAHRRETGNCSIAGWRMTVGHELGHAMGLNHNDLRNPKQLMDSCSNTSCATKVYGPQVVDVYIFNLLYPYHYVCPRGQICPN